MILDIKNNRNLKAPFSSLRKLRSNWCKLFGDLLSGILCLVVSSYSLKGLLVENTHFLRGIDMSKIKVSISVDDAHINQISEIAKSLQSVGMDVEQTLPSIGVISGSISSDQVNRLDQIEGVQHVDPERSYQLAPPDSDVQ
jgi:hypothetical protein